DGGRLPEVLRDLMARHEKQFAPLAPGGIDAAVTEVMHARNLLLHMAPNTSQEAIIRLYWLSERLILLMKACLLGELGIPVERQLQLLGRIPTYVRLRSLDSTSP